MRYLLKILPVIALILLGLPAAASAHGGLDDDGVNAAPITASDVTYDQAVGTSADTETVIEASNSELPMKRCFGACCCQGMSHCSSSCGAPSVLNAGDAVIAFDAIAVSKLRPYDPSIASLDRKFGLERPPRG